MPLEQKEAYSSHSTFPHGFLCAANFTKIPAFLENIRDQTLWGQDKARAAAGMSGTDTEDTFRSKIFMAYDGPGIAAYRTGYW